MYFLRLAGLEASKLAVAAALCGFGAMLAQYRIVAVSVAGIAVAVAAIVGAGVLVFSWGLLLYRWQTGEIARFAGDWIDREVDRRVETELAKFDAEVVDRLADERLASKRVVLVRDALDLAGVPEDEAADVIRCVETGALDRRNVPV